MKYILVTGADFNKVRKQIRENKDKTIIFTSSDDEFARKVLEKEPINILLIEQAVRKDKIKQRMSGFNQVLAKTAKKKEVTIGIGLNEILGSNKENKAEILGRIRQNVILCNKNKLKMVFVSSRDRDEYDLKSLGISLGMPTWMTKNLRLVALRDFK